MVGRIVDIATHPSTGRLLVCRVEVGAEVLTIVCGAHNIAVGDHVPLALVGSVLPTGKSIAAEQVAGVVSEGMLCSAAELGFSDTSAGILLLPSTTTPGASLASQLELRDVALEVNVTPNRPDCLNIFGIARELSALTGVPLKPPDTSIAEAGEAIAALTSVTVEAPDLCPRYAARLMTGVHVGPSPLWLQRRLLVCGSRPRNNVVDATNYLLLELGHPLHAFDYDTLHERRIVVRTARPAEHCVTLDGIARTLDPEVLVIADADSAVGIAGVMGGQNSEIREVSSTCAARKRLFSAAEYSPDLETAGPADGGLVSFRARCRFRRADRLARSLCGADRSAGWRGGGERSHRCGRPPLYGSENSSARRPGQRGPRRGLKP